MTELTVADFVDFFRSLWGTNPFAWQQALARRVIEDGVAPWPEAIALPTAAGKTACMDIAVFALAAQAHRRHTSRPVTAPRRVFFVVDRRVIVDEAFGRAQVLAEKLTGSKDGIVRDVADRLCLLAGSKTPLAAFELRGGILRSDAWARSPTQPLIVTTTVDQFGSRLLFRAYGPGCGMRPIQAGLAGNDSLILLDEAHCALPFLETLQAVQRYRGWAETPPASPFWVTVMSATPPEVRDVFRDSSNEGKDPLHPLGKRQLASKPARLVVAKQAKGKDADVSGEHLAALMTQEALRLVDEWRGRGADSHPAVVLFCNRVDTARKIHGNLVKQGQDVILLTGRMRPIDKDDSVEKDLVCLSAEHSSVRTLPRPLFVVATQTLEVGANLDFDLLVTECAGLDALRQRFGRLNRMGRGILARAVVVVRADQADRSDDDPVYGAALSNTWRWLKEKAQNEVVDFGIAQLEPHLPDGEGLQRLNAPRFHAPVLLPAHVDALAQTDPEPWPSPEVALFLHGPESGAADVQVCWRADLTGEEDELLMAELLARCPPVSPECLSVPIAQIRRWLLGGFAGAGADVEGREDGEEGELEGETARRMAVRWLGAARAEIVKTAGDVAPGDVLVIPAHLGGWDELGTLGASPIPDWGDRAYARVRDRALLRLHPGVVRQWPGSEILHPLIAAGPSRFGDEPEDLADDLRSALTDWREQVSDSQWLWLRELIDHFLAEKNLAGCLLPHPTGGLILAGRRRLRRREMEAAAFSDEDDESSSGQFNSWLLSGDHREGHLEGVAKLAERNARLCGLSTPLVEALRIAGLGHDLGKADPRFQAWLRGGIPWVSGPLLAKSGDMPQGRAASRKARARAGYPRGARHELLSVRLLESAPDFLPGDEGLRDLVLHLVESHHGHCRPFAPPVEDPVPVQVQIEASGRVFIASSATGLERLDAGPAERFWRLTRNFGWWGLCWLESLLRLADHRRSELEEIHGGGFTDE